MGEYWAAMAGGKSTNFISSIIQQIHILFHYNHPGLTFESPISKIALSLVSFVIVMRMWDQCAFARSKLGCPFVVVPVCFPLRVDVCYCCF
jgi:hypothetical protein